MYVRQPRLKPETSRTKLNPAEILILLFSLQIPGNKMTAANLAVIFGPNLLQRERGGGGDVSPQALGMEDSTAIIGVTLVLIQNHKKLFMVLERSLTGTSCCVDV